MGASLCGKKVANVTHPGDLWLKGDSKTTVLTVIKEGFQVLEAKGHHRIFVVDPAKAHSTTVQGNTVVINIKVGCTALVHMSSHLPTHISSVCHSQQFPSDTNGSVLMQGNGDVLPSLCPAGVNGMPCPGHRVPQPGTAKPEASGLRPTDIVSQLDVVKLLAERKDKLELVMGKTLEELEIFEVRLCDVLHTARSLAQIQRRWPANQPVRVHGCGEPMALGRAIDLLHGWERGAQAVEGSLRL